MAGSLFGFQIVSKDSLREVPKEQTQKSFALPAQDDGAVTIQSGAYYGTYVDLDGIVRNEVELITRYREMSLQPELETAIDEICNEAIVMEDSGHSVDIVLDELKQPDVIKQKIFDEFAYILKMLNFGNKGHDIFKRWYIDGRIFYHIIIDETDPAAGIQEIRYIDPRRIRKIREIQKGKDPASGMEIIVKQTEYYLYNERGVLGTHTNLGTRIAMDSVVNVNSGLMDAKRAMVLSYLHKAIKALNQVRMMEDATVIYRLSRAPERRIFYVDVGNMPTIKADQYLRDIMVKYRNKLVYDSTTGEIRDDRKHLSMLEDFWLPRREGSKGTEITTLPGGQNLGVMEDVKYFQQKLYKSLGVPIGRLEPQQGFSLGRTTEITRDEIKFNKFIQKLRNQFSVLFDEIMRIQLSLKKICTIDEWKYFKEDIWYDFKKDNSFNELKESELMTNRLTLLQVVDPYVGRYYSMEWVKKHVLQLDDEEIAEIQQQMDQELQALQAANPPPPVDGQGNPIPLDVNGQVAPPVGMPPPLPGQQPQQQMLPPPQQKTNSKKGVQENDNPLVDTRKRRFINDTLEVVKH